MVLAPDQASSPKRCSGQVHLDRSWTEVGPGLLEGLHVLAGLAALWCPPPSSPGEELDCVVGEKVAKNVSLNLLLPQSAVQEVRDWGG